LGPIDRGQARACIRNLLGSSAKNSKNRTSANYKGAEAARARFRNQTVSTANFFMLGHTQCPALDIGGGIEGR
jgi:hypothetical protein